MEKTYGWRAVMARAALLPMNLQLFAEGADGGDPNPDGEPKPGGEPQPGGAKTLTQAEVDELITRRLARAQKDMARRLEDAKTEGLREGEERAKLSAEDRAKRDREREEDARKKREDELNARERDIMRRELRAEAMDSLLERGLPKDLEQLLDYSSEDGCKKSLDSVEKVFRAAVQAGIDERIRGSGGKITVSGGANPDPSKMTDAEYYALLKK